MKKLYLVRHAKSSWATDGQPDFDRPLNERGYHDAHLVSKHLHKKKFHADSIISSPAIRAITTALIFAENLRYSKDDVILRAKLYDSTKNDYIECIHSISDKVSTVMIFGHNPVISETAAWLFPQRLEDMTTCCVLGIEFEISSWKEVTKKAGVLKVNLSPASLKGE